MRIFVALFLISQILLAQGCASSGSQTRGKTVQIYFPNQDRELKEMRKTSNNSPPFILYPAERTVTSTSPERATLEALLAGPTYAETTDGYSTMLTGLTLSSFRIEGHEAFVDLVGKLQLPGLMAGPRLRGQIEKTLHQFPSITTVRLTINGIADFDSLK